MKRIVRIAAGILLSVTSLCAQTNNSLVVFSEGGERFYLILNGLRQNDVAATNVKAVALNQSVYKAKVIFEQKGIPDADKTMYMTWEGMDASNMEFVCSIKKDKKGKYKWSFVSTAPISANSPYASIQPSYPGGSSTTTTTVNTNNNAQVATNANTNTNTTVNTTANTNGTIGMNTSVGVNDNTSNTNTTVTTTTTTTQGTNDNVNVGMNLSAGQAGMNGMGINMNINITDPTMTGSSQATTSTSTTTSYTTSSTTTSSTGNPTTTTTYSSSNTYSGSGNPNTITTTTNYSDNSYNNNNSSMNSNTASTGCGWAMSSSDFAGAKKSIASKSFEDSKLTVAKQILNSNCLNTAQVKEIMDQFTFEQNKLDWAKYAYNKTTDRNNYFKINDGFTFEASIDELNEYISKQK